MSQFDNVAVVKQANVYFDGKCQKDAGGFIKLNALRMRIAANLAAKKGS